MSRIHKSPESRADVREIWHYIAEDSSVAADRLLREFDATLEQLVQTPNLGRRCDELAVNLRSILVGAYLLFYRSTTDGIELVRVLHGARDLRQVFKRRRT